MATDYDAPRRNEADELGEDSLEELKARRAGAPPCCPVAAGDRGSTAPSDPPPDGRAAGTV